MHLFVLGFYQKAGLRRARPLNQTCVLWTTGLEMARSPVACCAVIERFVEKGNDIAQLRDRHRRDVVELLQSLRQWCRAAQHGVRLRQKLADCETVDGGGKVRRAEIHVAQTGRGNEGSTEVHAELEGQHLTAEHSGGGLVRIRQARD